MKKFLTFFTVFVLFMGTITTEASELTQKKVMVYLKPDVNVVLYDKAYIFEDANGQRVYPIIYNGIAYLPIRAVSSLMKEPIEWDQSMKTVFIGKTLSNPSKTPRNIDTRSAILSDSEQIASAQSLESSMVTAYLMPNALIMHNFIPQIFKDANNQTMYPINYNGSMYMPIRAVSELMGKIVEWNGTTKSVIISNDGKTGETDGDVTLNISEVEKQLRDIFDRTEILYYEATAKITHIKTADTLEEKQLIAEAIASNYLKAQAIALEVNAFEQTGFSAAEEIRYDKIAAFTESTENYLLVLENIAYLAAADSDYSMLEETFLDIAIDSQVKMNAARP